ncbi:hypothetical protein Tco_0026929 [Tanacetum coccineum]
MTPSSTSSDGNWLCPFRGFHCCPDGEVGKKGIARLISHLKRLHLSTDERKYVLREAISADYGLYMAVEKTMKVFCQWLYGKCMTSHCVTRACHHPDGLVCFSIGSDNMSGYIVGISIGSNKETETNITEGLVLDVEILDRVFKVPITTVKCVPHGCRLAFSQALKTVLHKVVAQPDSVDVWVRLLLFPRCTLQVCRPKNRQERRWFWMRVFGSGGGDFLEERTSGTSCGRDGLTAQHILDALCGEVYATASDLLKAITSFINLWLARRCSPILVEFVASFPLTPLLKPDNGIRPIAVGTICRRLVSKVAIKGVDKEMSKVVSGYHNDGSIAMLTAMRLYIGDTHIWSATGVHQGDPLGPLLFTLELHRLVHKIRDNCKLLLHAWYLNDGTVIGDSEEVAKVLDIIRVSGPCLVLELNINKTEIFWPSCNGTKLREGLFPIYIRRPSLGVKLLGGAVSRDAYFISGLAMRRAVNAIDLMGLLPQLHDPQRLRGSIESMMCCEGPFFGDLQWRLASLPIRFGGLGLYSAKLASSYAFVASRAQSWVLQDHILRDSGICGMDDDYVSTLDCLLDTIPSFDFSCFTNEDIAPSKAQQTLASSLLSEIVKDMKLHFEITVRHKAVFECLRAPHAQDFLLVISIDGLGQHMSPVEYRIILKYRLMIPLFPVDGICPVCR